MERLKQAVDKTVADKVQARADAIEQAEEEAAQYIKNEFTKPVVSFIAGQTARISHRTSMQVIATAINRRRGAVGVESDACSGERERERESTL